MEGFLIELKELVKEIFNSTIPFAENENAYF